MERTRRSRRRRKALLLRDFGIPMLELLDLEGLATDRVKQACLIVTPQRIQGGTGSAVNPVAIA
jgi:hypothetical protein